MNPDEPFSLGESWVFEVRLLAGRSFGVGRAPVFCASPSLGRGAGRRVVPAGRIEVLRPSGEEPTSVPTNPSTQPVHGLAHEPVHEPVHDGLHVSARPLGESIR